MGAPLSLSKAAQAATGLGHFAQTIEILQDFDGTHVILSPSELLKGGPSSQRSRVSIPAHPVTNRPETRLSGVRTPCNGLLIC